MPLSHRRHELLPCILDTLFLPGLHECVLHGAQKIVTHSIHLAVSEPTLLPNIPRLCFSWAQCRQIQCRNEKRVQENEKEWRSEKRGVKGWATLKQTELKQEKKEPCDTSERGQSPRENLCVRVRAKCNQIPIETLWQPLIHNPSLNMERML